MNDQPQDTAGEEPTLDMLTEQYRQALDTGDGRLVESVEAGLRQRHPDYADQVIRNLGVEHDQNSAIDAARSALYLALDQIGAGVLAARNALGEAHAAYDVDLVEGPAERLIPTALDQINLQWAAIEHLIDDLRSAPPVETS